MNFVGFGCQKLMKKENAAKQTRLAGDFVSSTPAFKFTAIGVQKKVSACASPKTLAVS
jgi:hypothetical protein